MMKGKITVKTRFGEIAADRSTLISICIAFGEAYLRLWNMGVASTDFSLASDYLVAQQELLEVLRGSDKES